ncbi:MAG TPA: HesA/MoeB/ThiF family protein [Polyangiaceae bacterium]|jgi:adenylyltransferase/sulfurtransferase|nr:HesA/MoeB/ThiF family protein [Polyangiaceae bacterium]
MLDTPELRLPPPVSAGLPRKRVLLVGLGGLGCPVAWVLAQSSGAELVLLDDDEVDESNLGRQVLFDDGDIGRPKIEAGRERLLALGAERVETIAGRLLPENARELVRSVELVVEGSDNYATKFLAADAAHLESRPIVHGAAVGWRATAWSVSPQGAPCYRCLFEEPPSGPAASCTSRGVMGAVVGFTGALMADLALAVLSERPRHGTLWNIDGKRQTVRPTQLSPNSRCSLCSAEPRIVEILSQHYQPRASAA